MGTYLSTPILDKHTETGADTNDPITPVNWAVVDMQGWRKSMEDAHVARTDVALPGCAAAGMMDGGGGGQHMHGGAKVFAVFDGHGGAEVARFCQMHLVSVLTSQKGWKKGYGKAQSLSTKNSSVSSSAMSISNHAENSDVTMTDGQDNDNSDNEGNTTMNAKLASNVAEALIDSFHALDRLIDDPNQRSEVDRWRLERPPVYVPQPAVVVPVEEDAAEEAMMTDDGSGEAIVEHSTDGNAAAAAAAAASNTDNTMANAQGCGGETTTTVAVPNTSDTSNASDAQQKLQQLHLIGDDAGNDDDSEASSDSGGSGNNDAVVVVQGLEMENNNDDDDDDDDFQDSLESDDSGEGIIHDDSDDDEKKEGGNSASTNDDDDGEVDGEVDASPGEGEESGSMVISATDAYSLFQKLLHMNGSSNDNDDDEEEEEGGDEKEMSSPTGEGGDAGENGISHQWARNDAESKGMSDVVIPTQEQLLNPPTGIVAPSASIPTKIQNGRKVCNLPDHPVHAGCTSVVAVVVGRTLVVANAGDSRAVLCRAGGLTEPLSFDHKPLQKREMNRITKSGGFVNQFGRVNGNLNLSRSIGDLKYKQVPGIPPPEQMITAEPDIISTTLMPGDEFIILGCDGIWDCLSNEECVKYVRDRIDSKNPRHIGMEMLDEIVSADPRASQGIGGDNMTIMIIDLIPQSRPYFTAS